MNIKNKITTCKIYYSVQDEEHTKSPKSVILNIIITIIFISFFIILSTAFYTKNLSENDYSILVIFKSSLLMTIIANIFILPIALFFTNHNMKCPKCKSKWIWHKSGESSIISQKDLCEIKIKKYYVALTIITKAYYFLCKKCKYEEEKMQKDFKIESHKVR